MQNVENILCPHSEDCWPHHAQPAHGYFRVVGLSSYVCRRQAHFYKLKKFAHLSPAAAFLLDPHLNPGQKKLICFQNVI
jgi:hypothetical protein